MKNQNEGITIQIRTSAGGNFTIGGSLTTSGEEEQQRMILTPSHTILQVKEIISKNENSGYCSVDRQRLIHKGRILNDNHKTLQEYGIVDSNQSVYLVKSSSIRGGGASSTSQSQTPNVVQEGNNTAATVGTNITSSMANPFFGMQGPPPGMDQLLQDPQQLSSIMNSPMMQSLMNNPDFFRNMMESNPQMRQLLDSNPELRHVLDDPELMRRSMEMMRDPSAMQNMMRNQDLAMSQIENIPGGFSALRRMYEDVQEPMMDAMANGGLSGGNNDTAATGSGSGNGNRNRDNENRGAAGAAMPNPWATPSSSSSTNISANTNSARPAVNWGQNILGNSPNNNNPWAAMGGGFGNNPMTDGHGNGMGIEQTLQMLENPMVNQMMNNLMSDPATMQLMMQSNPMLRQLSETNPQIAQMMSNPEFMRTMLDPNNLRSMLQIQNSMQNLGLGLGPGEFPGSGIPGGVPPPNAGSPSPGLDFSTLLNPLQSTSPSSFGRRNAPPPPPSSFIPPEQRYRIQLQSLNDMGFDDNVANIAVLEQTHGNVNRAIDLLLTSPPSSSTARSSDDAGVQDESNNNTNNNNNDGNGNASESKK
mmetsp:Transcript_5235/g.9973  ORF Transcript_5235/g.9973 Transcript_5235/m.9973 type:complete len:589 (-) Transcript_5235:76-1842(-)